MRCIIRETFALTENDNFTKFIDSFSQISLNKVTHSHIKHCIIFVHRMIQYLGSPPAWGRGLKQRKANKHRRAQRSPPAWGRGLKQE